MAKKLMGTLGNNEAGTCMPDDANVVIVVGKPCNLEG